MEGHSCRKELGSLGAFENVLDKYPNIRNRQDGIGISTGHRQEIDELWRVSPAVFSVMNQTKHTRKTDSSTTPERQTSRSLSDSFFSWNLGSGSPYFENKQEEKRALGHGETAT